MFSRILVGTDGSGTAALAVRHAVDLAKKTGGELVVVSVYAAPKDQAAPFGDAGSGPAGIEVSKGLLEDVEKRYGGDVKVRTVAREGSPADVIIDTAADENIDVVIVGNRGMTGAKRFVLGSVPNAISHHAPCHVLIVHTTEADEQASEIPGYDNILIATDGSDTAKKAVRLGFDLARAVGAQTTICHVGDDDRGARVLQEVRDEYGETHMVSVNGDPADKIIDTAERENADLIVVGNKGMTGARRFLLGSVPNQVSHHAPCNVLIVKTT